MNKITLTRFRYNDDCTLGVLEVGGEKLYTLELPNKGNRRGESCIPEGFYEFIPHGWGATKVKFTKVWEVSEVDGRSAILFHAGNTTRDTEGCILVGMGIHSTRGESNVYDSRKAVNFMRSVLGKGYGVLEIRSING